MQYQAKTLRAAAAVITDTPPAKRRRYTQQDVQRDETQQGDSQASMDRWEDADKEAADRARDQELQLQREKADLVAMDRWE